MDGHEELTDAELSAQKYDKVERLIDQRTKVTLLSAIAAVQLLSELHLLHTFLPWGLQPRS